MASKKTWKKRALHAVGQIAELSSQMSELVVRGAVAHAEQEETIEYLCEQYLKERERNAELADDLAFVEEELSSADGYNLKLGKELAAKDRTIEVMDTHVDTLFNENVELGDKILRLQASIDAVQAVNDLLVADLEAALGGVQEYQERELYGDDAKWTDTIPVSEDDTWWFEVQEPLAEWEVELLRVEIPVPNEVLEDLMAYHNSTRYGRPETD
jgi:chromosome segregation ATPase